jgi:chromosome partitioning protein
MEVIAVANQKGGSGKTTTSINLSTYLALRGEHTLLIDLDPQGATTTGLGIDKWNLKKTIYNTLIDDLSLAEVIIPTKIANLDLVQLGLNKPNFRL